MSAGIVIYAIAASRDWMDYASLGATIFGLIVVIFYASVTYWQARLTAKALVETQRSNQATEKSNEIAERSQRAWLILVERGPPVIPSSDIGSGLAVNSWVRLRNVGGVPAVVRRYGWGFVVGDLPERFELDAENSKAGAAALFGEGTVCVDLSRTFDADECTDIANRKAPLYLYWIVEYSDCLEKPWRTVKCWRYGDKMLRWDEATEPQGNRLE